MIKVIGIEKEIRHKQIFTGISFNVNQFEKVGLIGRNGTGKTTIAKIITGEDKEYIGNIEISAGIKIISTSQEVFDIGDISPLEYILNSVGLYQKLKGIIREYEDTPTSDLNHIQNYSDAISQFHQLSYDTLESDILKSLDELNIPLELAISSYSNLSGGQKRFVELVKVIIDHPDLIILDEPTNHLDTEAKKIFISWFNKVKCTVIAITHDRDLLMHTDKIIELHPTEAFSYKGNYESYLKQSKLNTLSSIHGYEMQLKELESIKSKRDYFYGLKAYGGNYKVQYLKFQEKYDQLKGSIVKPNFWIDEKSLEQDENKVKSKYESYKSKNITIRTGEAAKQNKFVNLLTLSNVSIGYNDKPLFKGLNLQVLPEMKYRLIGRNGTGKTSLLNAIIDTYHEKNPKSLLSGQIEFNPKALLGIYYQEAPHEELELSLEEILSKLYLSYNMEFNDKICMEILSNYMFDPKEDRKLLLKNCSGGQKARIQIIKMLINKPNILILDEPTNHLDLPSIEELEKTIINFKGSVLFVSHDQFFCDSINGKEISFIKHNWD